MDRTEESIIFIDTHIVLWLYENRQSKFSKKIKDLMNSKEVFISPILMLELAYLKEIKRIEDNADTIYNKLNNTFELQISPVRLSLVIKNALNLSWTRDLFDRLIVANAAINRNTLITADKKILKHYSFALAPK